MAEKLAMMDEFFNENNQQQQVREIDITTKVDRLSEITIESESEWERERRRQQHRKPVPTSIVGGTACFRKELEFHTMIQGTLNGLPFVVEGKGHGNSNTGKMKGKWICTSGKLPMSWAALSSSLGHGFKCFAKFPNGLSHFFQECMPEGYTQERVIRFQDDGTIKTYHEIHFQKGVVMNKVTLHGEGFKQDSVILNNGVKGSLPTEERTFPFEDGIKSIVHQVYPVKVGYGFAIATQTTVNRPLGSGRNIVVPAPHFTRSEVKQFRNTDDDRDHIIQEEITEAHRIAMFEYSGF